MKTDILLIPETVDNAITATGPELAGLAGVLQSAAGTDRAMFLVPGSDIRPAAEALASRTGLDVLLMTHPDLRYPNPEMLAPAAAGLAGDSGCRFICFPHTSCGCQAAAKTAAALAAPCLAGVDRISRQDDGLVLGSGLCNGKLVMETRITETPLVLTILPGAFSFAPDYTGTPAAGRVTESPEATAVSGFHPLAITRAAETDAAIDQADILVAAGRGIGDAENLALVENLARLLPNAAVAASRPLCDLKWLPYSRQVGATGKTVAPRLYLACGISGAQQHVYGMKDSQWIAAINTDPRAAIFTVADYCIVEDLITFLPLLAEVYKEKTGQPDASD